MLSKDQISQIAEGVHGDTLDSITELLKENNVFQVAIDEHVEQLLKDVIIQIIGSAVRAEELRNEKEDSNYMRTLIGSAICGDYNLGGDND